MTHGIARWPYTMIAIVVLIAFGRESAAQPNDQKEKKVLVEVVNAAASPTDLQICSGISDKMAEAIIKYREELGGFGSHEDLEALIMELDPSGETMKALCACYLCCGVNPTATGKWRTLPYETQYPNGGGQFPTAHATMLPTGKVLFFPEFDSNETLLWDPTTQVTPLFSYPDNFPNDWLWCSHHVFLSTGELMAVGGGGNLISGAIDSAWRFDPFGGPNGKGWWTQAASMANRRWYPTLVNLGEGLCFVASGYDPNVVSNVECEIYDDASDTWTTLTGPPWNPNGADRSFPETYPSLHVLPTGEIFFSRTGWHNDQTPGTTAWYFRFTSPTQGEWIDMTSSLAYPDRTEGMAVQILKRNPANPHEYDSTIMVVGGGTPDPSGQATAESIHVSPLAINTPWNPPTSMLEPRQHAHAVLLPDGTVLGFGGDWPLTSEIYSPGTNTWTRQGDLQYPRGYHSTSLLLPSGQVMTAGGDFEWIEIFDPPYLFKGTRPKITSAPSLVHHGQSFKMETTQATIIKQIVLVRPMSVTHHTDSEQRVLAMDFTRDGTSFKVRAPDGIHPHPVAPRGWYMLFALNCNGVPSVARWIFLH
jgi:hypothetical protein